jgi:Helix-turn-helix domain
MSRDITKVELLGVYQNQTHVLVRLIRVLNLPVAAECDPVRTQRQQQTRLDELYQTKLVEAYKSGNSVNQLAQQFGIASRTASAILERHGIKRRYKILTSEDIARARKLYEAGASYATIGEHFKVNPSTVRKSLLGAGVESRPVGTNQWKGAQSGVRVL